MTRYSATEVNDIIAGRWRRLWLIKSGREEREDLSRNFRVQLGRWTEEFNLRWLAETRDAACEPLREGLMPLPADAELLVHPESGAWARRGRYSVRPDGIGHDANGPFVVEAKHVADRDQPERVVQTYLGQLFVAMHVLGVPRAVMSVIFGANRLTVYGVSWSDVTWAEVERWVDAFDGYLLLDIEPRDPVDPPWLALPLPEMTNRWRPARTRSWRASAPAETKENTCVSV